MILILGRRPGVRVVGFWAAALALIAVAGCGASHARYIPSEGEARTALETALRAWTEGRPAGPIAATPPVRVVDSTWQAGQRLASFRVLDETAGDDGTRRFTVVLNLKPPTPQGGPQRQVAYVVHGRDPVWVFRGEDYERVIRMDNNPPVPRPQRGRGM